MLSESSTNSIEIYTPYPWQQCHWQRFQQQVNQKKRPHALLLNGQRGIGKWDFARLLAYSLLCVNGGTDLACGRCRGCLLNKAETHPDLLLVFPEQQGKLIKIDQVRQLQEFISKTSQQGHAKVVVMGPVEALNLHASNALLKMLEEPAGDTLLLLVTRALSAVTATIRSRCQLIPMTAPNEQQSLAWLESLQLTSNELNRARQLLTLSAGAPLMVKNMVAGDYANQIDHLIDGLETVQQEHSSMKVAKQWLNIDLADILEWWLQITYLLVKQRSLADGAKDETDGRTDDKDILQKLRLCCQHWSLTWLFRFSDKLLQLKKQCLTGANFNKQLLLEELLLDWQLMGRSR